MSADDGLAQAQSLVLSVPPGEAVAHVVLTIPNVDGAVGRAIGVLGGLHPTHGLDTAAERVVCSIGFSFAGLEHIGLPEGYLRLLRRLAPAFAEGADQRSMQRGDGFANAPGDAAWPELAQPLAHVLVSWHGGEEDVEAAARKLANDWPTKCGTASVAQPKVRRGKRLGAKPGEQGQWVHFGYRDGISELWVGDPAQPPAAPDWRPHAPGTLLLGHVDDEGTNAFALAGAPDEVRAFFRNSSFGVLRPMEQDLSAFHQAIEWWVASFSERYGKRVSPDFVKAKWCGRWPGGQVLKPGDLEPPPAGSGSLRLDFGKDAEGLGCPFGSHVRRMRAAEDRRGQAVRRPLQRRSVPFGPASWDGPPTDGVPRGLIGHFFCASIENQFEHLLGQWGARAPLGFAPDDRAADPLIGPNDDPGARLRVPLVDRPSVLLGRFTAWVRPLGTMYAWYPDRDAWAAILESRYLADERDGPWL